MFASQTRSGRRRPLCAWVVACEGGRDFRIIKMGVNAWGTLCPQDNPGGRGKRVLFHHYAPEASFGKVLARSRRG